MQVDLECLPKGLQGIIYPSEWDASCWSVTRLNVSITCSVRSDSICVLFNIYFQMFDLSQEDLDSALGEICSSSDNDVDLLGGNSSGQFLYIV